MIDVVRTPVREFGLNGIIKDVRPWDVPVSSFTSAIDVRIEDVSTTTLGDIRSIIGPFVDDATGLITILPVFAAPFWISSGNGVIIVVMDNGEVRSYSETSMQLLLPSDYVLLLAAAGVDTTAEFYSVQAGEFFILTSITNIPQVVNAINISSPLSMADMNGWPSTYRAGIMENYKNTLVAADISINGIAKTNMVKWSHPYKDGDNQWFWDQTDPTLLAGENPIQSDGEGISALQPLRDSLMVYFDRSMWRMDFVGGQFVMNFRKVFSDDGAVDKYAVENVEGKSLVVGLRDIYMHDGVQKQSLSDLKLTRWFYSSMQLDYPVKIAYYPLRNEVWITFRRSTSGDADVCLIYNTIHNAFTEVDLSNKTITNQGDFIGVFLGPRLLSNVITYSDISASDPAPDGPDYNAFNSTSYASIYTSTEDTVFYGLTNVVGSVTNLDAVTGDSRLRQNVLIEHTRIDLDSWLETHGDKIIYISRIFPQLTGVGRVQFRFGTASTPNSAITWESWVEYDFKNDYAVDFRAAGRYLAYQIKPFTGETPIFSISGFDMEWAVIGEQ